MVPWPSSSTDVPKQSFSNLATPIPALREPGPSSSNDEFKQSLPNPAAPIAVVWEPGPSSSTDDFKQSLPNLAAHFAVLTNAIQRRITDGESSDKIYNDFVRSKMKLIKDLKKTYRDLYDFYCDPSQPMPDCFHRSPPTERFFTGSMDARLESRKLQIGKELRAFVEGQGFLIQDLRYIEWCHCFSMSLQLDVAKVPTTGAREEVGKKLVTLEGVWQSEDGSEDF